MTTRFALALVALILGITLAGCGLEPVYGTHANDTPVAKALDDVYVANIPDRSGQKLRNELIDRMYQSGRKSSGSARYTLSVSTLSETIYGLGIAKDATATRSQIKITTTITLSDSTHAKPLMVRSLRGVSSFNALASQYTTLVTENDARDQVIRDIADQITTLLELYFSNPTAFAAVQPEPTVIDPKKKIDQNMFAIPDHDETSFSRD